MSKTLIAYFSRADENYFGGRMVYIKAGNTEIAAKKIHELTGGDLFKIEPASPYPAAYADCVAQSRRELAEDARPGLARYPDGIDGWDTIVLAYPCWCGTMPMPVFTFLARFDFSGKVILPLCTNEGSGMGSSPADIKKLCPGADIRRGLSVAGSRVNEADGVISGWLEKNLGVKGK